MGYKLATAAAEKRRRQLAGGIIGLVVTAAFMGSLWLWDASGREIPSWSVPVGVIFVVGSALVTEWRLGTDDRQRDD